MVLVPFFNEFQKALTCEHYIDDLVKGLAGLSMSPVPAGPRVKHHLVEIEDSGRTRTGWNTKKEEKGKEIEICTIVKIVET